MIPLDQHMMCWTSTVFFIALLILSGCGGEPDAVDRQIRPVRFSQATVAGSEQTRTFPGTSRAASEQDLAFRVSGIVTTVEVDVGSTVRKGQVLVRLDSGDLILRQQQAEAGLAQARAQSRNAKANYERVVALYETGNTSLSDMDAVRASFESANASEVSAETALRLAQQQVAYAQLLAPISGSVSQVRVDVNESVNAGQTVVVLIDTGQNPEVQVTVPEAFIGGLRSGQSAQVMFGALSGPPFNGLVTEVGSAATGAGGFPVIVQLTENEQLRNIRPGMAAEVTFQVEGQSEYNGVLVPPQSVQQDHLGRFVFVLMNPDEANIATAERRIVMTGSLTPDGLEILDGVLDGEYVATAGLSTLETGQQVRLLQYR